MRLFFSRTLVLAGLLGVASGLLEEDRYPFPGGPPIPKTKMVDANYYAYVTNTMTNYTVPNWTRKQVRSSIKESLKSLVILYSTDFPWCRNCQNYECYFRETAILFSNDRDVLFARFALKSKQDFLDFQIKGIPQVVLYHKGSVIPFEGNYFVRYPANIVHIKGFLEENLYNYRTWPKDLKWNDETFYWDWEDVHIGLLCPSQYRSNVMVGGKSLKLGLNAFQRATGDHLWGDLLGSEDISGAQYNYNVPLGFDDTRRKKVYNTEAN